MKADCPLRIMPMRPSMCPSCPADAIRTAWWENKSACNCRLLLQSAAAKDLFYSLSSTIDGIIDDKTMMEVEEGVVDLAPCFTKNAILHTGKVRKPLPVQHIRFFVVGMAALYAPPFPPSPTTTVFPCRAPKPCVASCTLFSGTAPTSSIPVGCTNWQPSCLSASGCTGRRGRSGVSWGSSGTSCSRMCKARWVEMQGRGES